MYDLLFSLQNTVEDLIAATAYLELFIRSVTEPGLLFSFVQFLLEDKFDGERILDHLVQRINSKTRVCHISNFSIIALMLESLLRLLYISCVTAWCCDIIIT